MQLRLGLDSEAEVVEVWATLEAEHRVMVIERLATAMAKAVAPAPISALGEETSNEDIIESKEDAGDVSRIA